MFNILSLYTVCLNALDKCDELATARAKERKRGGMCQEICANRQSSYSFIACVTVAYSFIRCV